MRATQDDIAPWLEPDDIAFRPQQKKTMPIGKIIQQSYQYVIDLLDKEALKGTGFLLLPVLVGSGAVVYFQLAFEPAGDKLSIAFILALFLARLLRSLRPLMLLCLALAACFAGAIFAKIETTRLSTRFIPWEITSDMTLRVLELQQQAQGGYRLTVEIVALPTDDTALKAGYKLNLVSRTLPEGVNIGSGLQGLVRLRPPSGAVRRASYDFSFHAFYRGMNAQGFFMGTPQAVSLPPASGILAQINLSIANLRHHINKRITSNIEGEAGAIASALITGQRAGISMQTNEALRLSGLAHILSISGLHMAMVTGMVLLISRLILGIFTHFSSHYPAKKIAALIALCVSFFYLLLSGSDVAAQRSFIMMAIMLLAILCDRSAITMRNLALAAMVTLIFMPHEIMGPSFQMSFSATAALIAAYGWWRERRRIKDEKPPTRNRGNILTRYILWPIGSTAIASLIAGSSSGIFAAFHFANTAPLGIIGNAAAFPLMSIAVMPFALLATLLMPLNLEWLPLQVMGFGIEWVKKIAFFVADISPDINPGFMPPQSLGFLTIGLVLLLFLGTRLRLFSLVAFLFGFILYIMEPTPLVLISEDARLIAVQVEGEAQVEGKKLALSNPRPPNFILSNWLALFNIKPDDVLLPQQESGFTCQLLICHIILPSKQSVLTIAFAPSAREQACLDGDIVVLNYLDLQDVKCNNNKQVITLRQLALYGTAALYEGKSGYQIEWTIGQRERPWYQHRQFSKIAHALP